MPPNNPDPIQPGEDVAFPQDGPNSGTAITRVNDTTFNLAETGIYQVFFRVSVDESGQLVLTLNDEDIDYTVVGRSTGTSAIIGMVLIETTEEDSVLTVRNPEGNADEINITQFAGGDRPVSANLIIMKIQ